MSDCLTCHRIGIWNTEGPTLITPCFNCAKENDFLTTNGTIDGILECSIHDVVIHLFEEKYESMKQSKEIIPSVNNFNCINNVFSNLNIERTDLQQYLTNKIIPFWNSLGSLPTIQENDHNHEINHFRNVFIHQWIDEDDNYDDGDNYDEDDDDESFEYNTNEYKTNEYKTKINECSEILYTIMYEKDGKMDENNYLTLMNILSNIYSS